MKTTPERILEIARGEITALETLLVAHAVQARLAGNGQIADRLKAIAALLRQAYEEASKPI